MCSYLEQADCGATPFLKSSGSVVTPLIQLHAGLCYAGAKASVGALSAH